MRALIRLITATLAIALAGATLSPPAAAAQRATVIRWSDGDTVVTTAGTIRLIGLDTPERGQCGSRKATRLANRLAPPGSRIRLIDPAGVRNRADDGRLLRYVVARGRDVGAAQIKKGSWAAFDGRDGYQRHVRQARYRRLDRRHANHTCGATQISGPVAPTSSGDCPSYAPIKGNRDSMIYHSPGQEYYAATNAEQCFRNGASAESAGYRPARGGGGRSVGGSPRLNRGISAWGSSRQRPTPSAAHSPTSGSTSSGFRGTAGHGRPVPGGAPG